MNYQDTMGCENWVPRRILKAWELEEAREKIRSRLNTWGEGGLGLAA